MHGWLLNLAAVLKTCATRDIAGPRLKDKGGNVPPWRLIMLHHVLSNFHPFFF
jgi:hypothetical protein